MLQQTSRFKRILFGLIEASSLFSSRRGYELDAFTTSRNTRFFVWYHNYGPRAVFSFKEYQGSVKKQDNVFKDTADFLEAMEFAESNLPWWAFYYSLVCYKSEAEWM